MKTLTLLMVFLATSALADVEVKVNRMEMSSAAEAEETVDEADDAKAVADDAGYNSSRSNNIHRGATRPGGGDEAGTLKGQARDAVSGLPTGKRQHALDTDSDDDGLEDAADDCDDDCDSPVDEVKSAE